MRILKGLSSRLLPCGCLAGVYETYEGEIVTILDAKAPPCGDTRHEEGKPVPEPILHPSPRD
jgi:hypothetical protein